MQWRTLRTLGLCTMLCAGMGASWQAIARTGMSGGSGSDATAPARTGPAPVKAQHANPQESTTAWQWETVASGLNHPWGVVSLPGGGFLVTERNGGLRQITAEGKVRAPVEGLPMIAALGQGGLLDVALDEDFERNRRVYFCYAEPEAGAKEPGAVKKMLNRLPNWVATPVDVNSTALAVGELSTDGQKLEHVKVLFSQRPKVDSKLHFGCRIVLQGEHIYLTLGDRYSEMEQAQRLDNHLGKIIRINRDGSVPADNPFVKTKGALPEIWSYGHRNMQGATLAPDGSLWTHEHGAQGGDEINLIAPGVNYGWPVITYGKNYGGGKIGEGLTEKPGMAQPFYYWLPSVAPSGMTFVRGSRYGADWKGNLLVGSLKFMYLGRLVFDEQGRVKLEEKIPVDERVRDVLETPDGQIHVLTDSDDGKLLRLKAAGRQ